MNPHHEKTFTQACQQSGTGRKDAVLNTVGRPAKTFNRKSPRSLGFARDDKGESSASIDIGRSVSKLFALYQGSTLVMP
jgi:hypothetical protein